MTGSPVLVVDRRDRGAEGGNIAGPLPRFGAGVGGIDEIRGDGDRVCLGCPLRFAGDNRCPRYHPKTTALVQNSGSIWTVVPPVGLEPTLCGF